MHKDININKAVHLLREHHYCIIDDFLDDEACDQAVDDIDRAISMQREKVDILEKEGTGGDQRCFKAENISTVAHEFGYSHHIEQIATQYCKQPHVCSFVLAGKLSTSPDKITNSGGGWHQDSPIIQFKSIVYLTDVTPDNGPFLLLPSTSKEAIHSGDIKCRDAGRPTRYCDEEIESYCSSHNISPIQVTGKKGTAILVDTSYLHRGSNIISGTRYSLTTYYFPPEHNSEKKWGHLFMEKL